MTRETKVGLLIGIGVVLLIAIIVSDHLSVVTTQQPADMTEFAPQAQQSITGEAAVPLDARTEASGTIRPAFRAGERQAPIPTPEQLKETPWEALTDQHQQAPPRYPFEAAIAFDSAGDVPSISIDGQTQYKSPPGTDNIHYVQPGETLATLAQRYYNDRELWATIAAANPGKVDSNGRIEENTRLVIPSRPSAQPDPALAGDFAPVREDVQGSTAPITSSSKTQSSGASRTITVQSGDSLSSLAARHLGDEGRWNELYEANRDRLSSPDQVQAGMMLRLPGGAAATAQAEKPQPKQPAAVATTYTVQPGDTLTRIARRRLGDESRWEELFEANRDRLSNKDQLVVGQKLKLPS